ncbi:MAG: FAD-binding oxidoreductase, partial [Streptomycetaceae bacterium]|nr:FAD-binding oxidoreductase [Streptomycetaceae bacterium]
MESPVAAVANLGVDVRDDDAIRTAYSSDASLYRVRPLAVVRPRRVEEIAAVLALSRDRRIPVTARGGGTSLSGNAIGPGLILDTGRHMNRVLSIDPDAAVAVVEPGVVPARLNRAAAQFGLRFGPDPSTHTRCTIGGMIGNNSCGARSLGYGRTVENVEALDVITGVGEELSLPAGKGDSPTLSRVADLVAGGLATIRTEFGRFDRQISGYALEHLLPERGFDVARALVGSEGTLAVVTRATVRLVPEPAHRTLVALGYPDIIAAADAGPAVRALGATACEGIDARTVDVVRNRRGPGAVPPLPRGNAWLFVELAGSEPIDDAAARR